MPWSAASAPHSKSHPWPSWSTRRMMPRASSTSATASSVSWTRSTASICPWPQLHDSSQSHYETAQYVTGEARDVVLAVVIHQAAEPVHRPDREDRTMLGRFEVHQVGAHIRVLRPALPRQRHQLILLHE